MKVEIDGKSGFCFGVTNAIRTAEEILQKSGKLYCLEDIVHNSMEVSRLETLGLKIIDRKKFFTLKNCRVLLRAHGEPPSTYAYARANGIELVDATCPVVRKLQKRVNEAFLKMQEQNGQILIFGKKGHAEVNGLNGQTGDQAIVVEDEKDLEQIDLQKPIVLFSQTTKSPEHFNRLVDRLRKLTGGKAKINDTICRQVSNRAPQLKSFASRHDIIIFAGGKKSSNANYLFTVCKQANPASYFVSTAEEIQPHWFNGHENAGVCGATSTPEWLMEKIAARIRQL